MFNIQKKWQREMLAKYLQKRTENSSKISELYSDFEKISAKYLASGEMKEGDETFIPLSNGVRVYFTFYNDATAIDTENISEGKPRVQLLSREAGRNNELAQLIFLDGFMSTSSIYIGEMYPEALKTLLSNFQPGEILSFTDGNSYTCVNNDNHGHLDLTKVFDGNLTGFTLENLSKKESVRLDINQPTDLQKFYNINCKTLTERTEYSYTHTDKAKENIRKAEQAIERGEIKEFSLGNIAVFAKKSRTSDDVIWYDGHGDKIEKGTVALVFGLLANHLRERTFKYEKTAPANLLASHLTEKQIEEFCANKEYDKMFQYITDKVLQNAEGLSINFKHFTNIPGTFEYLPETITFVKDKEQVKCYAVTYENNNFANDVKKATEIDISEFVARCHELYDTNCHILKTRTEEEIVAQYQKLKEHITKTQQNIIDKTVEQKIDAEPNMTPYDLKPVDIEVKALLAEFMRKNQQQELPTSKIKKTLINNGEIEI